MNKKIEIILKGEDVYRPDIFGEIARAIGSGRFEIEVVMPRPLPIIGRGPGGRSTQVIGYRPSTEPPRIYLTVTEGEGSEDKLFDTAEKLLDFYETEGEEEFRYRFGSPDIVRVCRLIVEEGRGNPHPWHEKY